MFGSVRKSSAILIVGLASWLSAGSAAFAQKSMLTVSFDTRSVTSTLWVPDQLDVIRGVIVFTGGQGQNDQSGDTRPFANDRFYQRFAESIGFAILGNQFTGSYTEAGSGPGQALLDTLAQYATKLNRPELANAPLLLEGFSNGGYFSITFTKWKPERVIAFALNKSGFSKVQLDPAFAAVPGVLFWGELEQTKNLPTVIHALVAQGRKEHALWAELKEWGRAHEEGDAERMFVPFFAQMVAARYPAGKTPRDGAIELYALDESSGWLGDPADASLNSNLPTVAPFASYAGDKTAASWLPDEGLANVWRGFVTKSPIELDAPSSKSQQNATQPLQLSASELTAGDTVTFFDGAAALAKDVPVASGAAGAQWLPAWGGGRGIVAIEKAGGVATRTSRPAVVAVYGKAPPPAPPRPASMGTPAAPGSGGVMAGAMGTAKPERGDAGTSAPTAGSVANPPASAPDASQSSDASLPDAAADGGQKHRPDAAADGGEDHGRTNRHGPHGSVSGGSCAVAAGPSRAPSRPYLLVLGLLVCWASRRRGRRQSKLQ